MEPLSPAWKNLILRLKSIAPQEGQCRAIIKLAILFEAGGEPILWGRPVSLPLEPKNIDLEAVLRAFVGDDDNG